ncbi:putative 26S proteasome non-ATPase regulatory subunit [Zostera marina]|uniref:Putative 26S proteasome non-ATPase regulatory subunit n=1 Tax=Zostera marina TaxID=29655 RepID=A0A0K9PYZ9_ZOSMR|nr:putative 26S proteasome non-ATPase regulatory subunit [Zostera marina]
MEGDSSIDLDPLIEASSEFASYPGMQTEDSVREFLERFPLTLLFSALQETVDEPIMESNLVTCLEVIFKTKYGASLIPQYIHFVQAGMQSDSQIVKCLTCKVVYIFLDSAEDLRITVQLIKENDIYNLLLKCLLEGDADVASASTDAISKLAMISEGADIIFPRNANEETHLKRIATHASFLARVRILALIAKLFSISISVATMVYDSNLLNLYEAEISNTDDMLMCLSALELLYELAESPHSIRFLLKTTLLQLLSSLISNNSIDSTLRSRAFLLTGKLLSASDTYSVVDETSVKDTLLAIDERLEMLKDENTDECESALEALGQVGTSINGATLLFMSPSPVARHVVYSAFSKQGRGVVLAALHALGIIAGIDRSDSRILLCSTAEDCLRQLIYKAAVNSSKLTPSALILSVLRKEPEIRLAAYRLISALITRQWFLIEVCSKHEIIDIVSDSHIETSKNGMDYRYKCCTAIYKSLSDFNMIVDPTLAAIVEKLQDSVKRGPYLPKRRIEAQPLVVTADR